MSLNFSIFISGGGSNAEQILKYFSGSTFVRCPLICTNNPRSGAVRLAEKYGPECVLMSKAEYNSAEYLRSILENKAVDVVVLAGYLKRVPAELTRHYHRRMVNIHPALLPAYGGKGMYGIHIHRAVVGAKEEYSGLTIHYVNEQYDEGEHIFQKRIQIEPNWDAERLQKEILALEHYHFPRELEKLFEKIHSKKNSL